MLLLFIFCLYYIFFNIFVLIFSYHLLYIYNFPFINLVPLFQPNFYFIISFYTVINPLPFFLTNFYLPLNFFIHPYYVLTLYLNFFPAFIYLFLWPSLFTLIMLYLYQSFCLSMPLAFFIHP